MRVTVILDLLLVAWFFGLATAEIVAARRRCVPEPGGDGRLITNFGLGVLVLVSNSLLPMLKIGSSLIGQGIGGGLAIWFAWPWMATLVVFILADSLAGYWSHRLMHMIPWLWRIHRVHHADNAVDVSTSLRNHPLELVVVFPISVAVVLVVGASPTVVLAGQTIMVAASIWQHADIAAPRAERVLAPMLITPAVHRIHHSPERSRHDSNFGDLITLWDRLFGTFRKSEGRGQVGLEGQVARPDRLLEQIWSPVYGA